MKDRIFFNCAVLLSPSAKLSLLCLSGYASGSQCTMFIQPYRSPSPSSPPQPPTPPSKKRPNLALLVNKTTTNKQNKNKNKKQPPTTKDLSTVYQANNYMCLIFSQNTFCLFIFSSLLISLSSCYDSLDKKRKKGKIDRLDRTGIFLRGSFF